MLAGSILLLILLASYNDGYGWFYDKLLKNNFVFMNEAPNMTYHEKMYYKLGFSWKYLNFIKENTPEDAIILMPPDSIFLPRNKKSDFNSSILSKEWSSYFVYPRKLVYEREKTSSPLYKQANYIAIVDYCGYSKLPYEVKANIRTQYSVLPMQLKNIK